LLKGRPGVRVGPSLGTPENVAKYSGAISPGADPSCAELGLDVRHLEGFDVDIAKRSGRAQSAPADVEAFPLRDPDP